MGPRPLPNKATVTKAKRAAFNAANKERRQHWAESATLALAKKLAAFNSPAIDCEFNSYVERPHEVIDTYGRFVGDICVGAKFATNINIWLTEQGWAYPGFYTSMGKEEIEALLAAAKKGRAKKRIWKDYSKNAGKFETKLLYRKGGPAAAVGSDSGPVLMPKLYRRQVTFRMQKAAKLIGGTFGDFLKAANYECQMTAEFLKKGVHASATHDMHEFLKGNTFQAGPDELVFKEDDSKLLDANGKSIEKF